MSEKKAGGKVSDAKGAPGSVPRARAGQGGSTGGNASTGSVDSGFTAEERAAMREYAQERKVAARRRGAADKGDGEKDLLAKIAQMPEPDRTTAQRVHAIIKATAPELVSRTWYGMPAYARDGNVVCFFQNAQKFKTRYSTLGFSDKAALDDGNMWATAFALNQLTAKEEQRIAELVKWACSGKSGG